MPPQTAHNPQKPDTVSSAIQLVQLDRSEFMMSCMRRGPFTVLLVVAMSGCGGGLFTLPTAPSDLTSGITIYEHWNYQGASAAVTSDIADLGLFEGPCRDSQDLYDNLASYLWAQCISSIRVAPGWRAIVYSREDFRGESLEITADVPNLQLVKGSCPHDGLNDCIASIKVPGADGTLT